MSVATRRKDRLPRLLMDVAWGVTSLTPQELVGKAVLLAFPTGIDSYPTQKLWVNVTGSNGDVLYGRVDSHHHATGIGDPKLRFTRDRIEAVWTDPTARKAWRLTGRAK